MHTSYDRLRKFGLILVEHTLSNAFDSENIRFLRIIAQQVGIVMENAELYLKMKEMARKDGLQGYTTVSISESSSRNSKRRKEWLSIVACHV